MEARKQAILTALDKFVRQRAGLEFGNYGDVKSYRSEQRSITKSLHDYRELERRVSWIDGITAEMLLEASTSAYSGRLTIKLHWDAGLGEKPDVLRKAVVSYCTGQYFPTEYRNAACAVLAAALWAYTRERTIPAPTSWRVRSWGNWDGNTFTHDESKPMQINAACAELEKLGGQSYGHIQEYVDGLAPGDWMRRYFAREFGARFAARWFN